MDSFLAQDPGGERVYLLSCLVLTGVVKSITAGLFFSVSMFITYASLTLGADMRTSQYNEP